ncbi:CHAD domain-containing protein [Diaminobutyricimonas aerilata]|uniref:CHAD domain-containing protein n=1 Tax=Diaminobutyricimonas aerilata TaxID=1162967 RepID=A0A2M9CL61_9MICO|nr:CYTH and CHAD domain-containing protein [Diaminobutyricimonas aerilata]PJJ72630.1 CHAD domain-containing protein [Diaminobutyricimonas aerilata]
MAVSRSLESERKYDVDDRIAVPPLARFGEVHPEETVILRAVYFDTERRDLARRLITLRRRAGGGDEGWHIKLPARLGRVELHAPLADEPPAELLTHVAGVLRGRPLREVARLSTSRTVTRVHGDDGEPLFEVADDLVSATDVGTGILRIWREWEVELLSGAPEGGKKRAALLDAVQRELETAGAEPASSASKLARALGRSSLTDLPPVAAAGRDSSALEIARALIAAQLDALVAADPGARTDETDGVHALRTAIRRVRAVLAALRGVLDASAVDPVRDALGEVGRALGRARDAEVRRARLTALLGAEAEAVGDELAELGPALIGEALDEYRTAYEAVTEVLDSPRWFDALDALDDLVARPPLGENALEPGRPLVREQLLRAARRAEKRWKKADDDASRHAARKAARRTRYLAEALTSDAAPLFGGKVRALGEAAEALQDALGEHRDASALAARLGTSDAPGHLRALADSENDAARAALREAKRAAKRFREAGAALD